PRSASFHPRKRPGRPADAGAAPSPCAPALRGVTHRRRNPCGMVVLPPAEWRPRPGPVDVKEPQVAPPGLLLYPLVVRLVPLPLSAAPVSSTPGGWLWPLLRTCPEGYFRPKRPQE